MPCTRSSRLSWRLFWCLSVVLLPAMLCPLQAQTFDATNLRKPTDLNGIWRVQAGDDPSYASPAFDDSHWTRST